MFRRANNN